MTQTTNLGTPSFIQICQKQLFSNQLAFGNDAIRTELSSFELIQVGGEE